MRVGRGAGRVATIRLHQVARIAAQEVHAASASNPQALHEFLRTFAANLQPTPGIATRTITPTTVTTPTVLTTGRPNPRGPRGP
jgi:hypothetical protein